MDPPSKTDGAARMKWMHCAKPMALHETDGAARKRSVHEY